MFLFMNGLRGVGRGIRSSLRMQSDRQWVDNQSLESWQIQGMGEASPHDPNGPHRDLSIARGTTGLGNLGSYLLGKGTGQQGTETGFGFASLAFRNQGLGQATALGAAGNGAPGLWASPTMGMGMSGFGLAPLATGNQGFGQTTALDATASGGPGQWTNPSTGTGISGFGLAQPAMGNQGFGQATTSGATAIGGPGQGVSPTTGTGINVVGVQGSVSNPCLPPPIGLPPVGVQPIAPSTGLATASGAYVPAGMPPALAGTGGIPGTGFPQAGTGTGRT